MSAYDSEESEREEIFARTVVIVFATLLLGGVVFAFVKSEQTHKKRWALENKYPKEQLARSGKADLLIRGRVLAKSENAVGESSAYITLTFYELMPGGEVEIRNEIPSIGRVWDDYLDYSGHLYVLHTVSSSDHKTNEFYRVDIYASIEEALLKNEQNPDIIEVIQIGRKDATVNGTDN